MKVPVFVIHVKGNIERERHIVAEVERNNLSFEFVLDGNKEDLTESALATYFKSNMLSPTATTSCAYKHFLAYEKVLSYGNAYALILEDDIKLSGSFLPFFDKSLAEIKASKIENFILSYEYSITQSVKRSERKKGKIVYKKDAGRFTGIYLVDVKAVNSLLNYARKEKCDQPIDWFHNECVSKDVINMYWSYPALGQQYSHNGRMSSLIDENKHGFVRSKIYMFKKLYSYIVHYLK